MTFSYAFVMSRIFIFKRQDSKTFSMKSFFDSIGRPKFISAPMVDQSELAFRLLVRNNGADLCYTQMMHAKNFVIDGKYRKDCIDWIDYHRSDGNLTLSNNARSLDRPLIAQLAGNCPDTLVKAASFIQRDVDGIDLNLGCPQNIARRGNYGAYLLQDREAVKLILKDMVARIDCPITAKIRIFENDFDTIKFCQDLEHIGIQMLTIHGRTVHQNKQYVGEANWDIIRKIKQSVRIPIIANGGISCLADALQCLEETGCDAIMSSEALLENPKLFSQQGDYNFHHNFIPSQLETVDEYIHLFFTYTSQIRPINHVLRGHLFKMLFRFIDAPNNSDLRLILAEGSNEEMLQVVHEIRNRLSKVNYNSELAIEHGLMNTRNWYMRHRDEFSSNRILPRRRSGSFPANSVSKPEFKQKDVDQKLSELKERLLRKKNALVPNIT